MNVVVEDGEGDFVPSCSEQIAEFADLGSADAIAGLLRGENVHTKVEPVGLVAGLPRAFRVLVDPRQLHRAGWILKAGDVTEAELVYLATGSLGGESES